MSAASRTTNGSASRSPRHRTQVNLSTIEKSVTHLLVATKQLLETLTAWSRQQATEAEVSDVYVRLGSEFNIACRAFTAIGVETADLGNVPDALRTILEHTLSQDASPQSLDVYLPRIREIIINLLHGLKRKQQKLRQKQSRENGEGGSGGSGGSGRGSGSLLAPSTRTSASGGNGSNGGGGGGDASVDATVTTPPGGGVNAAGGGGDEVAPPRTSSLPMGNAPPQRNSSPAPPLMQPGGPVRTSTSTTGSTRSSHQHNTSASSIQAPTNSPPPETTPPYPTAENPPTIAEPTAPSPQTSVPPPPPTPPIQDALAALQQHSTLERRASRRYSAYQIAKYTGKSTNDLPVLPTSRDPSAIPRNRESMDAVRKRSSGRTRSMVRSRNEPEPTKNPHRISEEGNSNASYSPIPQTPEDKLGLETPAMAPEENGKKPSLHVDTGAASPAIPQEEAPSHEASRNGIPAASLVERRSSTPSERLTLFLQLGRSIKKVTLSGDAVDDLSITSLRLLFISKFNYNPPSGDDFPELYLQDPVSGVRYELEDLRDVKDRSVLCLNVEVLDEVKRHIDDGIDGLKRLVQGLAGTVESQGLQMTRVAERQEEAAKKIAELSVTPPIPPPPPTVSRSAASVQLTPDETARKLNEVRDLRKDLAVLRQVFSTFVADMNTSMTAVKTKASTIKKVAAETTGVPNEGRAYVEKGRAKLGGDADNLVTKVDDLQDTVEDLRKDVVLRGVRPLPRQLEEVSKQIAMAKTELKKMTDYIKREKPLFRRVWERELMLVCEEQEFFTMQESLINDLEDDLDKASQTFILVEQCSEQQSKTNANGARSTSRNFPPVGLINPDDHLNPSEVKHNVLSEVRALQPNHESRLEAIERAEKARQKELEGRIPEFQKELGQFVEENKLKKAGGVEEAERLRMARDEQARKEIWELKKQMEEEEEESSEEEDSDEEEESVDGANDS
ncbi:actin interacting protein 3-domain-containing protein [Trichophaea hybrida]|nr:actin interacting protein 3-domain-containing protein [Trichophaea hybrida]